MGTIASVGGLNASSQFGQLGSLVRALLGSVCERAETAFRRVHVQKQDAEGNILFYGHEDTSGSVKRKNVFTYIEDVKSGALYLDDVPSYIIRIKCVFAAIAMPFYTLTRMAWHAMQTSLIIGMIAAQTLRTIGNLFHHGKCKESVAAMRSGIACASTEVCRSVYEIVKSPLFALGCELAVLYGIMKPYHGRAFEAMTENIWQNGVSYKENYSSCFHLLTLAYWKDFAQDIQKPHPCYLARCFQSHGNVRDARFIVIKREAI